MAVADSTEELLAEAAGEEQSSFAKKYQWPIVGVLAAALVILAILESKIRTTIFTVVLAVVISGGIWVTVNLLFDQVRERFALFNTIVFGAGGALIGIVLHGNHATLGSGDGFFRWVVGPIVGAAVAAPVGYLLASERDPKRRQVIGVGAGAAVGTLIGLVVREINHPGLDWAAIVLYTLVFAAIGAGISLLRKKPPIGGALIGGALGWLLGAWGGADLGDGSIVESWIASIVPATLIGARLGMTTSPDYKARVRLDTRSRAAIFVGPALLFIMVLLVIPAIRTGYLSLFDRDSEDFVGLDNYQEVFTDKESFDASNWADMFTSRPFIIGVIVLAIAAAIGYKLKERTGKAIEIGNATMPPLVLGALLVSFGVFTAFRGTIVNNAWWVVVVTFGSTAMGLAIAVLADQRRGERIAKSIIFMPMAISLVGASIIWRFVYVARDTSVEQTGVFNALWVGLGKLSTGSGVPTIIVGIVTGLILLGLLAIVGMNLTRREPARAVVPGVLAILVGWFFIRYIGAFGTIGVGGFEVDEAGNVVDGETVNFVQDGPYNNFWLMLVMIWIQTGFAMVILSAAMKAVPTELLEAARIDGATESQVFWRVTLPQIATTIGVVVTTTIVGVMKVYDIVKVMTNGQFGTQVLANNMFQEAFGFTNTGKGAALAMLIFLSVLPIMYTNIRRMQEEA